MLPAGIVKLPLLAKVSLLLFWKILLLYTETSRRKVLLLFVNYCPTVQPGTKRPVTECALDSVDDLALHPIAQLPTARRGF